VNNEVTDITTKIEALDAIRAKLEQDLLKLQEEELELDDECELTLTLPFRQATHSALQWKGFGNAWNLRILRTNLNRVRVTTYHRALGGGEGLFSCLRSITSYLRASHSW